VGVNDYWGRTPPAKTVTNIRRLVKFLRGRIKSISGVAPYIAVATLTPNGRAFQRPFVEAVNTRLLALDSPQFPVRLRFDTLPETILSEDLLHPNGAGYDLMTDVRETFLRGPCQK
jgi:lysophospholipase L1-like esterase